MKFAALYDFPLVLTYTDTRVGRKLEVYGIVGREHSSQFNVSSFDISKNAAVLKYFKPRIAVVGVARSHALCLLHFPLVEKLSHFGYFVQKR